MKFDPEQPTQAQIEAVAKVFKEVEKDDLAQVSTYTNDHMESVLFCWRQSDAGPEGG